MQGSLYFDSEFLSAVIDGRPVKLTRNERRICQVMSKHPGQLYTRDQLLTALGHHSGDTFDRNIDSIISRMRRKLGDTVKHPRLIETRYGEGYIWRYLPPVIPGDSGPDITLERPLGLDTPGVCKREAEHLFQTLDTAFTSVFQAGRYQSVNIEQLTNGPEPYVANTRFRIETLFMSLKNQVTLIINLADSEYRFNRPLFNGDLSELMASPEAINRITEKAYKYRIEFELDQIDRTESLSADPISVVLYDTARRHGKAETSHRVTQARIEERLLQAPDDARMQVMKAVNINNQMTMGHLQNVAQNEREIRRLVTEAYPKVISEPLYLSSCAELLYRVGERELGLALSREALAAGTHLASCFLVEGKLLAYEGQLSEALVYYDYALSMVEEGSTFQYMLLTLKAIAFMASDQPIHLRNVLSQMLALESNPLKRFGLKIGFIDNVEDLSRVDRALLATLPKPLCLRLLRLYFFNGARHYKNELHRYNLFHRQFELFSRKYGVGIASTEMKKLCLWVGA